MSRVGRHRLPPLRRQLRLRYVLRKEKPFPWDEATEGPLTPQTTAEMLSLQMAHYSDAFERAYGHVCPEMEQMHFDVDSMGHIVCGCGSMTVVEVAQAAPTFLTGNDDDEADMAALTPPFIVGRASPQESPRFQPPYPRESPRFQPPPDEDLRIPLAIQPFERPPGLTDSVHLPPIDRREEKRHRKAELRRRERANETEQERAVRRRRKAERKAAKQTKAAKKEREFERALAALPEQKKAAMRVKAAKAADEARKAKEARDAARPRRRKREQRQLNLAGRGGHPRADGGEGDDAEMGDEEDDESSSSDEDYDDDDAQSNTERTHIDVCATHPDAFDSDCSDCHPDINGMSDEEAVDVAYPQDWLFCALQNPRRRSRRRAMACGRSQEQLMANQPRLVRGGRCTACGQDVGLHPLEQDM